MKIQIALDYHLEKEWLIAPWGLKKFITIFLSLCVSLS